MEASAKASINCKATFDSASVARRDIYGTAPPACVRYNPLQPANSGCRAPGSFTSQGLDGQPASRGSLPLTPSEDRARARAGILPPQVPAQRPLPPGHHERPARASGPSATPRAGTGTGTTAAATGGAGPPRALPAGALARRLGEAQVAPPRRRPQPRPARGMKGAAAGLVLGRGRGETLAGGGSGGRGHEL